MDATNKTDFKHLVAIGALNGTIIGGALALAHRSYWLPLGVAIAAFITTTYAFACRMSAKR